jgi:molybdopterin-synthase adenylyltransferase
LATTRTASAALTLVGNEVPGALDRQVRVPGFDQDRLSDSRIVCIGAGGLMGHIAPTLVRKGVGALRILDHDEVEVSNLNRQRFYPSDVGENKAVALVRNLRSECTCGTTLEAFPMPLEEAVERGIELHCAVAVVGVDNSPARVVASRHFRALRVPVVFCAVSADAEHGYAFVQHPDGPCFGCLFPDELNDNHYPCPATPAIADILQAVSGLVLYAVDSCLMARARSWNYRRLNLSDGQWDACLQLARRSDCTLCRVERS